MTITEVFTSTSTETDELFSKRVLDMTTSWLIRIQTLYENMPMQYSTIFHGCKIHNFQMKKCDFFSYFCFKHRSWVHVRTTSMRRFLRVPTLYVLEQNLEYNVYPRKPSLLYKMGCKGVYISRTCLHDVN